jgi:hypothetical protein
MGEFLDEVLLGLLAQGWKPDRKPDSKPDRKPTRSPRLPKSGRCTAAVTRSDRHLADVVERSAVIRA